MNNNEYSKLVSSVIKHESSIKNMLIAFVSGGLMGLLGEILFKWFVKLNVNVKDSYALVFIVFIVVGSILTGLGIFDKILSICKCGLIVPSTGFANTMTSSAMDVKNEGFVKGIGSNIFKLTGSIILYGVIFGLIFGLVRGLLKI